MKKKKILVAVLLSPLIVLLCALLAGYFIVATEKGTKWAAEKATAYLPDNIQLYDVEGRLIKNFTIKKLHITHCEQTSELNDINIVWNAKKLFKKIIEVEKLSLVSADIQISQACKQEEELTLPDAIQLPIEVYVNNIEFNDITIAQEGNIQSIEQLQARVEIKKEDYLLNDLLIQAKQYSVHASMQGDLHKPFDSTAEVSWNFKDNNKMPWHGKLSLQGNAEHINLKHNLESPIQINTVAEVKQPMTMLQIDAVNQWSTVALPLGENPSVTLESGELKLNGNLEAMHFAIHSKAKSMQLPSTANIELEGDYNPEKIQLSHLQILSKEGSIKGQGNVQLKPSLMANLQVQGNEINPEFLLADFPGKLNLNADLLMEHSESGLTASMDLHSLSGILRDYKVNGKGKLHYANDEIETQKFNLAVGDNAIQVNGLLGKNNSQIEFMLNAEQLSQVHPDTAGSINGQGKLSGSISNPSIQANLLGQNIQYANKLQLSKVEVDGSVHLFSDQASNAAIQFSAMSFKQNKLDSLDIIANGNQKQHQLNVSLKAGSSESKFNLIGSYSNDVWQANIQELVAQFKEYGNWKLNKSSQVNYSKSGASLTNTCLVNEDSSICLSGQSDAQQNWQAKGNLKHIPLQLLLKDMQGNLHADGTAQLEFDLFGKAEKFQGKIFATTKDAKIRSTYLEELEDALRIERFKLTGEISPERSDFSLQINMDNGKAVGHASIENLLDAKHMFIHEGGLIAELPSIKFVNVLIPQITINKGSLNARTSMRGSIQDPEIETNIKLNQLDFYIPELGTEYSQGDVAITSDSWNNYKIDGMLQSQQGQLSIGGNISKIDVLAYTLDIQGKDFQVVDLPNKSLLLSPDLNIQATGSTININGSIDIPSANLVLQELPKGVIRKSADEVYVSATEEHIQTQNKNNLEVNGKVQLHFSENVHFEAKGIKTDLVGDLLVRFENKKIPNGQGVLQFKNASYDVLGQTLDISKGKMLFAGPINNPALDVAVTRTTKEVTAGMKIEGTVKKPHTRIFSSPAMSDGNALSYLISGKPLAEASGSQNAILAKAALSLGVDNSASITQQVATTVGLDEISFGGDDEGLESTSLILGKYLSPKLYVSYAHGLFSPVGTVGFDYQLTKRFSIEAETGTEQTIDLIYTFEKD